MKLIIDIDEEVYKRIKDGHPESNDSFKCQDEVLYGKPYEERSQITVFLENADESTLFDIKKELARILTERAEREAYDEARREAMREAIRESKCLDEREESIAGRWHI